MVSVKSQETIFPARHYATYMCAFVLCALLSVSVNNAFAEERPVDTFKISLGGYSLSRYESTMSLTDKNLGAGVSISPQDTLGMTNERTVFRLDGHYRFTRDHALTYSWYSIKSRGNKSVEEEFDWVDENGDPITIPVGAQVNSLLDYDIYKVGYMWSFYHNDKVELAAGAGIHYTRIAVSLQSSTTSSGIEAKDVSTSLPLPVLSFGLNYYVTPKFQWYLKSEFFVLKLGDYDGTYTDSAIGMEYRAFKNVGLGIGLGSNTLKLIEETDDYKFQFDNRITGILVYVAGYF